MKRILAASILLLVMSGLAMADFTEHPRYAQIQTKLQAFIQAISDAQAEYFIANGRYFGGQKTPEEPLDGLIDVEPNWNLHKSTQTDTWKTFAPNIFKPNVKVPFQISIDDYIGPDGWGWFLLIEIWIDGYGPDEYGNDGNHWRYIHHEGPFNANQDLLDKWLIDPVGP